MNNKEEEKFREIPGDCENIINIPRISPNKKFKEETKLKEEEFFYKKEAAMKRLKIEDLKKLKEEEIRIAKIRALQSKK